MNSVNLKYISTNKLVVEYEQKRTWLATHTDSPDFKKEHTSWQAIEQELNSRDVFRHTRLEDLHTALELTSGTGYFTVGERICINQERGYLLSVGGSEELRAYQIPDSIEKKVKQLK
ncbi:hypothetical protein [Myroides marinus]|uniref:hypothetical protein n=1 Tax=Myroides marinus TaxID=703342 RepID=UPI002575D0BD|nr:hypothetical protein [Myroides marinus]